MERATAYYTVKTFVDSAYFPKQHCHIFSFI